MKNTFLLLTTFILIIGFSSCDENFILEDIIDSTLTTSSAQILGLDDGTCDCCGDWKIEIEGEDQVFMFKQLPVNAEIDLETAEFPLSVTVKWILNDHVCADHIIIGSVELE